jgi:hypothetical protein
MALILTKSSSAIRACDAFCLDEPARFFPNWASPTGSESGAGLFSRYVLRLFQTCNQQNQHGGQRKEEP